ncbi:MAG TPA: hypothetical protein VIW24_04350 [Aldersonia sp.]
MTDLTLRHVDPSKLLFEHLDASYPDRIPSWFEEVNEGGVSFVGWINGTVKATIEARYLRPRCVVAVAITGFYASEDQVNTPVPKADVIEADDFVIANASEEEKNVFARRALRDMYPYLRAELQMLSSRMSGYPGISLQTEPVINAESVVSDSEEATL